MNMAALQGLIFSTESFKGRGIESAVFFYPRAKAAGFLDAVE